MSKKIYILGIHDGHNSGATLTANGEVLASINEERLSKVKNEVGYPTKAIDEVLRLGGINSKQLNSVVYSSLFMHDRDHLKQISPWYKVGLADQKKDENKPNTYFKLIFEQQKERRIQEAIRHLGVPAEKISFLEHHLCHLTAAYYTAPNTHGKKKYLGFTCDGAGDNIAATVSICEGNKFERIATTNRHASLGKIYSRVTQIMGMTPWEHEYKLMGMAPYSESKYVAPLVKKFQSLLRVNETNLAFEQVTELSMNYAYEQLREFFVDQRFDVIAGAVQKFTEDMLVQWVKAAIKKTGIKDIVCGGGVFMNVKANMLISQLPEVGSMYVMPSAGDESLSIGACLYKHYEGLYADHKESQLNHLYLGGDYSEDNETKAIESMLAGKNVSMLTPKDIDLEIAKLLSEGKVVARCRGPMEWGARALGNRSILCSPHDFRIVDKINKAIKKRDFWMPFAPSIKEECAEKYISDPKALNPFFMTFALPTKKETLGDMEAATHPRDATCRPQVVSQKSNPNYHRLITEFERLTGRGVVLNTSFNLHGYPIVHDANDAIHVFLNSELQYLALNHYLLVKKQA